MSMFSSLVKVIRGIVKLRGGTDNSTIGNEGDRLKVTLSPGGGSSIPVATTNLRYEDMNATTGGIARDTEVGTTWTDVYSYTGSGKLFAWVLNLYSFDKWIVRFIVDSQEVFGSSGMLTTDIKGDTLYDLDQDGAYMEGPGLAKGSHDRLIWQGPLGYPLAFNTNITIKIRRIDGESAKKFQAGLAVLQKDS